MNKELEIFLNLLNKQSELTPAEIEVQEKYFRSEVYGTENSGEALVKLKEFFFTEPKDTIEKSKRFWYSYWRWYSMLNWAGFIGLSEADMLFSLAYQVPMAVALDFNPADELRRWLALNRPYEEDMVATYTRVQAAFLGSEGYAGMWQGREVYLPELINEVTDVGFEEDSLRQAEFENKLTQVLFPDSELVEKYFFATSDVGVKKFISLAIFLESVSEVEVWLAVDSFMYPEKYADEVLAKISPQTTQTIPVVQSPKSNLAPRSVVVSKPVAPAQPTPVKPTPAQIKSQIEKEFSVEDVEGIMNKLSELAEENNDPKIAEMYYFDEKENKFKWNI